MDSLFKSQDLLSTHLQLPSMDDITGWHKIFGTPGYGEGNSEGIDSMADTATVPRSPQHLHKQRRLSRLLDNLAVHISNNNNNNNKNNNNYTAPRLLMFDNPCAKLTKAPEDVPLDLSIKSERVYSPPAVENEPFICGTCGQTFAVQDRLAKHVASRHRNRIPDSTKAYECDICLRRFARSDMLTRHSRLHSGVKPYSCSACGQVFSRSDHLATHQRTHTGEKPYRCPKCPYAACRRDMITRHMKTHTRRPQPV